MTKIKVQLVGTRLGTGAERARWAASSIQRHRHPELWDLYLETSRLDRVLNSIIQPDWCCFDGGCHVGSVLAQMTRLAPLGQHIAVEPVSEKIELLRRRFPDASVIEGALGAESGSMTFYDDPSGYASFNPEGIPEGRGVAREVEVITIDQCVHGDRLDLLKLDIEGAELWALQGGRETIRRELPTIVFECGPEPSLVTFGYTREDIYAFATQELNYSIYGLVDYLYGREPLSLREFRRAALYPFSGFNYVAVHADVVPERIAPDEGGW